MLGDEVTILTAAAATATQTSNEFVIPSRFEKFLLYMDVTVGADLLLDMELQAYLPGPDAWIVYATNIPSEEGITGTGKKTSVIGTAATDSTLNDLRLPLGGKLRVVVTHGNETAATYKVYIQPI